MKRTISLFAGLAALAAGFASLTPTALAAQGPAASQWTIGPVIRGKNYSLNMPLHMQDGRDGAWFDFPGPAARNGHVHYVTVPVRPIAGARSMTLRYRIDAARGVRFVPQESPGEQATLSLYFQRAGDSWTTRDPAHRWYSPTDRTMPLTPGTHTVTIAFDEPWIAMMGGDNRDYPGEFTRSLERTASVGFTFGSASGRGHGVYATGPARFTVLDFSID